MNLLILNENIQDYLLRLIVIKSFYETKILLHFAEMLINLNKIKMLERVEIVKFIFNFRLELLSNVFLTTLEIVYRVIRSHFLQISELHSLDTHINDTF